MWFPRPALASDVRQITDSAGLAANDVYALLTDPSAEEWHDKVGVVGAHDGSAKGSTRLLHCAGWVLKTDLAQLDRDPAAVEARISRLSGSPALSGLWHPRKSWFSMRVEDGWLPCTVCPRLHTIRRHERWEDRRRLWTGMIDIGIETARRHGILLDLNPSNFGQEADSPGRLYYIDDEHYPLSGLQDIGQAVVARIPEEPRTSEEAWFEWGNELQRTLDRHCDNIPELMSFVDGIRDYPLVQDFSARRTALLDGFMRGHQLLDPVERRRRRQKEERSGRGATGPDLGAPRVTLVLSDVHANLPALEAVLQAASHLRVTDHLFLGDAVGYGPFPSAVIDRLAELPGLVAVRGNHDHAVATGEPEEGVNRIALACAEWTHTILDQSRRDWLAALPLEQLTPPVIAVHGAPQDPKRIYGYVYELTYQDNLEHLAAAGLQLCWYGHTHVPFIHRKRTQEPSEKIPPGPMRLLEAEQVTLVNPGSVGMPRDGDPRASFAIFDWETRIVTFHRVPYRIQTLTSAISKAGLPEELIYRFEVGR